MISGPGKRKIKSPCIVDVFSLNTLFMVNLVLFYMFYDIIIFPLKHSDSATKYEKVCIKISRTDVNMFCMNSDKNFCPIPHQIKTIHQEKMFSFATEYSSNVRHVLSTLSEEWCPAHDHIPRQNVTQRYTYIIYSSNRQNLCMDMELAANTPIGELPKISIYVQISTHIHWRMVTGK